MTYKEALQKLKEIPWKTEPCHVGEECWCRVIVPVEKIEYLVGDMVEEAYIIGSGEVNTDMAEHIVEVHNKSLKK